MIDRDQIINHLAQYLNVDSFTDVCRNGIQVEGRSDIKKIVTGVSASERLFELAIDAGADMIIVHHGLFWKGSSHPFALQGLMKRRVKLLLDHDVTLAAYHLPLDAHPLIGNNIQLASFIGLENPQAIDVGFIGTIPDGQDLDQIISSLATQGIAPVLSLRNGPEIIHRIAIVSGGASSMIERMASIRADLFITGDAVEPVVRMSEELGIHFCALGHYNSEKPGPMALSRHIETQFGIPADFIDVPCPV